MQQTLALLGIASVFYTVFYVFVGKTTSTGNGYFGTLLFSLLSGVIPVAMYEALRHAKKIPALPITAEGMKYGMLAGITLGIFNFLILQIFSRGAGVSLAIPVIYGSTIVLATVVGVLLLKESVPALHLAGVAVVIVGIGMIIASKA